MGAEKKKSNGISFGVDGVEGQEMEIGDLKDDDRVVLRTDSEGFKELEVGADGGFIKRLEKVMKRHQAGVKLAIVGGTIIAVVLASERFKKQKKIAKEQ